MSVDVPALWRRAQHGWPAAYPLVQFPNAPLIVGIAGSLAARATSGDASDVLLAVSRVGIAVWAWEELVRGDNLVRRLMGAGGLVWVVVALSGVRG